MIARKCKLGKRQGLTLLLIGGAEVVGIIAAGIDQTVVAVVAVGDACEDRHAVGADAIYSRNRGDGAALLNTLVSSPVKTTNIDIASFPSQR